MGTAFRAQCLGEWEKESFALVTVTVAVAIVVAAEVVAAAVAAVVVFVVGCTW